MDEGRQKPLEKTKEEFLLLKEVVNEINHIGVNINQIVKNVNAHYYNDYEKRKLFALMESLKKEIGKLM